MTSVTFSARTKIQWNKINFEFGRIQGELWVSNKGKIARTLNLENDDKIEITIKKVKR